MSDRQQIAISQPQVENQSDELNRFYLTMRNTFNLGELRGLCFDLGIDYEDLGEGLGKSDRILALIYYVVHHGLQQALLDALQRSRPHMPWPTSLALHHPLPNIPGVIFAGGAGLAVNSGYGALVYRTATPRVRLRDAVPRPPRAPRGFIGRAYELEQLERLIAGNEPAVVFGPEGIGKSALLRQVCQSKAAGSLSQGVLFVETVAEGGSALDPGDLIQLLFDALFESEPPLKVNSLSARTYLSNTRPLVVVDHLAPDGTLLGTLLDLFPQSPLLLATDQRPSGNAAELLHLEPLPRSEARQLLVTKAGLDPEGAERSTLDALCALLNDTPLALVTVANTLREYSLTPAQVQVQLAAYTPTASNVVTAAVERAYSLTYAKLTPTERRMVEMAAVLPGVSVDKAWLEKVIGDTPGSEWLQALELLVPNSPRLRLPPGLRAAVVQKADESAAYEQLAVYVRHALAAGTFDFGFGDDEVGNLLGLVTWAARQKRWAEVIDFSRALDPYLALRGLWDTWQSVLQQALTAAQTGGDRAAEAWALHQLGTRELGLDQKDRAINYLQQALTLRHESGDATGARYTEHNLNFLLPPPPPTPPKPDPFPWGNLVALGLSLMVIGLAAFTFAMFTLLSRWPPPEMVTATLPVSPAGTSSEPVIGTAVATDTPAGVIPPEATTALPPTEPTATPTPILWLISFLSDRDGDPSYRYRLNVDDILQGNGRQEPQRLPGSANDSPSPDEVWIVLASQSAAFGEQEINLSRTDNLTDTIWTGTGGMHVVWSPDSSRFAFSSYRGQESKLYVLNVETLEETGLIDSPGSESSPVWSPDGTRLAFSSYASRGWNVWVAPADGSEPINLTANLNVADSISVAAWSPDSMRLYLIAQIGQGSAAYGVNADGSELLPLFVRAGWPTAVYPSPDGQRLVITTYRNGRNEMYLLFTDGSEEPRLINSLQAPWLPWSPSWSPDGRQLATALFRPLADAPSLYAGGLYLIQVNDGTQIELMTFSETDLDLCDPLFTEFFWSPDGRWIAIDYEEEIYIVSTDGTRQVNLTNHRAWDAFHLWGCG